MTNDLPRHDHDADVAWAEFARQMHEAPMPAVTDDRIHALAVEGRRRRVRRAALSATAVALAVALVAVALWWVAPLTRIDRGVPAPDPRATPSASASPTGSPPAPPSSSGPRATPSAAVPGSTPSASPVTVQPVDPADYFVPAGEFGGDGYFASSPSGNIYCGVVTRGADPDLIGCATTYQVPQVNCQNTSEGRLEGPIALFTDGVPELGCSGEGALLQVYRPSGANVGEVLPYGRSLTVGAYTLVSTEQGMMMRHDGGAGFRFNRAEGYVELP